ncbi:MAG: DUF1553 domain-containing protein, partial [Gemmataceae bacterium]
SKRRLEAEAIRDAILSISGELDLKPPVGSEVAKLGEGVARGGLQLQGAIDGRVKYRSIYLPVARDFHLDSLSLFDFADPAVVSGERATTSVPSQSLYLMNNPFVLRQADRAARRLRLAHDGDRERIEAAYLLFLSRPPSPAERDLSERFLREYPENLAREGVPPEQRRSTTLAAFCQALFGSAEFLYRN